MLTQVLLILEKTKCCGTHPAWDFAEACLRHLMHSRAGFIQYICIHNSANAICVARIAHPRILRTFSRRKFTLPKISPTRPTKGARKAVVTKLATTIQVQLSGPYVVSSTLMADCRMTYQDLC